MIKTYEVLDDAGGVINLIVAEQDFMDAVHPGKYREYVSSIPPPPPDVEITRLAFLQRLTMEEHSAILAATKTDTDVQAWYERLSLMSVVDLEDPRTIEGVTLLVSKNLLVQLRADSVLNDPITPMEKP